MSVTRSSLILGAGKVTYDSVVLLTKDDIVCDMPLSLLDINSSIYGDKVDQRVIDLVGKVSFTPVGEWENLTKWWTQQTPSVGSRLFGDTDKTLAIQSKDGQLYTFQSAQITKPPELFLSAKRTIFGPVEFTCLRKNSSDFDTASSFLTIGASAWATDTSFSAAAIKVGAYTAAWGAVAGFTAFDAQDGWTITPELMIEPIEHDDVGTVDYAIKGFSVMAKCKPVGATEAQALAAMLIQGTGNVRGRSLNSGAADLVITGTGVTVTLKAAQLVGQGFVFGNGPALRFGEFGWVTTQGFTIGVPDAIAVLA